LDMLINKTVEIAIEKEVIKCNSIIVDATHTKARYNQKSPKEILADRSKKLRKSVYEIDESMKVKFPSKSATNRSEEHTSELQSRFDLVCRLLLEKKKQNTKNKDTVNTK